MYHLKKEQDRFWGKIINDDTRKHHMEVDKAKMVKFRKNLEVQNYLKDQMAYVDRQRDI